MATEEHIGDDRDSVSASQRTRSVLGADRSKGARQRHASVLTKRSRLGPDHHALDGGLALVPVKARRGAPTTPAAWLAALTGSSAEPEDGSYVMVQDDRTGPKVVHGTVSCPPVASTPARFVRQLAFMSMREIVHHGGPSTRASPSAGRAIPFRGVPAIREGDAADPRFRSDPFAQDRAG